MHKVEDLKAYAENLKSELESKFSAEGQVMPRDLQDAPQALSPRKDAQNIAEELRKAGEKRSEILQNGRIEQLEAENEMLKEQVKAGIKSSDNGAGKSEIEAQAEMLENAEEKARLLQLQLDDKDKTLQEVTQEKDEMAKKLEELDLNLGNELSTKDQEI